jgi:hypothetical protein
MNTEKQFTVYVQFDTGALTHNTFPATSKKDAEEVAAFWSLHDWIAQALEWDENANVEGAKSVTITKVTPERP